MVTQNKAFKYILLSNMHADKQPVNSENWSLN